MGVLVTSVPGMGHVHPLVPNDAMRSPRPRVLAATAVTLVVAARGDDNTGAEARTVEIEMVDIAFEPDTLEVARGETVRFLFTNSGDVAHDTFIGDQAAQAYHGTEMREAGDDEHGGGHSDEAEVAITVEPGDTGGLTTPSTRPAPSKSVATRRATTRPA